MLFIIIVTIMGKQKPKSLKFKVGDLVRTRFPLELAFEAYKINEGEIGLIIGNTLDENKPHGEYDYLLSIKGREVAFFEDEIEKVEEK